ncbi:MAG TPA: nitroreductase [Pseudonocardiaceae bacterium]
MDSTTHPGTAVAADWRPALVAAGAAPSVHNTQPWRFVAGPSWLELHLDPARLLPVADPTGREARISCGAALLNLELAVRAEGVEPVVDLLPSAGPPTLRAVVRRGARRGATPSTQRLHAAIARRRSHRRPFHPAPVPSAVLHDLGHAASTEGGYLRLLREPRLTGEVAALVREAERRQAEDPDYREELRRWISPDGERADGVPHSAAGPRGGDLDVLRIRDFAPDHDRPARAYESDPLLGVLLLPGDTPRDQLRAGRALERVLLTATSRGVGASMISSPVELAGPRSALRTLLGGSMWPQLVLRFGAAVPVAGSPRRPVADHAEFTDRAEPTHVRS